MFENSKTVFITHPYFGVNNPTNNYRIYKRQKNSSRWTYIQCKNKEEYRHRIKEYIIGFFDYGRNEEKAFSSVIDYVQKNQNDSMFDYFRGSKKSEQIMLDKKMKREEMAILKDGSFLLDQDVTNIQKRWSKYIENSNIQMTVLSFHQDYIDKNISIREFQRKIAMDVMPKFLNYCGYEEPKKNLEWIVALHNDRENNYHFHISWIEKNKCYRNRENKLGYRIKLMLTSSEINFLKRQAALTVERKKLYTPALIELENNFNDLKSYFKPGDCNFALKNVYDLEFEEKIIELGFLLNQIRDDEKKYIKYNSLPSNEIGKRIRLLTMEIKKELFKNKEIKNAENEIFSSIDKINNILLDIDKRNNISNLGFENAIQNKLIKDKVERNENFVFNAIVNHALYNFKNYKNKIDNKTFTLEDIINQAAEDHYLQNYVYLSNTKMFYLRKNIIHNFFTGRTCKKKIEEALNRLKYEQEQAAEEFYEMLQDNEKRI